jgi:hypothetical protein
MSWTDPKSIRHRLPPAWAAVGFWEGSKLEGQLARECGRGHPLHKLNVRALARDGASDDVLFEAKDGRAFLVHLTWSRTGGDTYPAFSDYETLGLALSSLNTGDDFAP